MALDDNKSVFRRFVDVWANGDFSQLDQVVAKNYIGHVSSGDRTYDGLMARIVTFRVRYPDVQFSIEDQIVDGDKVATRLTARGTQQPTGKATTLMGLNISRMERGKITEEWATWEVLSLT